MIINNGKPTGSINFISFNKPSLTDGVSTLTVSQSFFAKKSNSNGIKESDTKKSIKIAVRGPRFTLDPRLVIGKFPPDKSLGEYYNVLPHIIFNRSILPWERKIGSDSKYENAPWLALLLFTKEENITPQTINLEALCNQPQNDLQYPVVTLEIGENKSDRIMVIDVQGGLLKTIMPEAEALQYLAHVRQSADKDDSNKDNTNKEYPIVICNRLPQPGNETTVYLVSLENRTDLFDTIESDKTYRLVTLAAWSFASTDDKVTFTELLTKAIGSNRDSNVLRMPLLADGAEKEIINKFYQSGLVPLPHQTRQGNQIVSWYGGPLLPGAQNEKINSSKTIKASDQLVRYYSDTGMFDVAYAAAWELGRLLMLRRRRVSVALFNWKRVKLHAKNMADIKHLPRGQSLGSKEFPDIVQQWFIGLGKLHDIPYNYLVPDEKLLPRESIRFFKVDPIWMKYLFDGAFSIGSVGSENPETETSIKEMYPPAMSGFLLRSRVVPDWPHMEVEGYNVPSSVNDTYFVPSGVKPDNILKIIRIEPIASDTLLCLFEGDLQSLDLHEKPEVIHFGVSYDASKKCYYKVLRNPEDGNNYNVNPATVNVCQKSTDGHWVTVPFSNTSTNTVDIMKLKDNIKEARNNKPLPPNKFAFEMVEGVQKVRIVPITKKAKNSKGG